MVFHLKHGWDRHVDLRVDNVKLLVIIVWLAIRIFHKWLLLTTICDDWTNECITAIENSCAHLSSIIVCLGRIILKVGILWYPLYFWNYLNVSVCLHNGCFICLASIVLVALKFIFKRQTLSKPKLLAYNWI